MMRLPKFRYVEPRSLKDAASILATEGPSAMPLAGGTDLFPNMKRRHQTPKTLVALGALPRFAGVRGSAPKGFSIGAGTTLTALEEHGGIRRAWPGLHEAVKSISTPILRNMGTLGGNICLDTRCNYYNQNYEWRRAIHFCMKCDGDTCWVAPGSDTCLAVSSSDSAPMLCALDARLHLVSKAGERTIAARELFARDGIKYLTKAPEEILTQIDLPPVDGWRTTYRKLRRREAFDFPVLGIAVALRFEQEVVAEARLWLGAVAEAPIEAAAAAKALAGRPLADEAIEEASRLAFPVAKPVDNTDFGVRWRKEMSRIMTRDALRSLRSQTR
ncbi:MAG TPA: FAD binding domain-containing protein [Verrucomicrobiae bacterium]|nr:FAD binding domain-containing protein [Verrucomicrobiae bacterium]